MASRVDWDRHALQTNLLANGVILASGFTTLVAGMATVVYRGCVACAPPAHCDWVVVPGHALEAGQPSVDFRARLERALDLCHRFPQARVLLLGGVVPGQSVSEAEAGAHYLLAKGLAGERIVCEDTSQHTLENFQRARALLADSHGDAAMLVTNRYHLARATTMARNLGLDLRPMPAEVERHKVSTRLPRLVWEAYLLHWYHVGRLYARMTRNRGMLERVSRPPEPK